MTLEVSPSVPIASDQGLPSHSMGIRKHPWCLRYPGSKANDPRRCSLRGACYWLSYGRNAEGVGYEGGSISIFSQGNQKSAFEIVREGSQTLEKCSQA